MASTRRQARQSNQRTMTLRNGKTLPSVQDVKRDAEKLRRRGRKSSKTTRRLTESITPPDEHAFPQRNRNATPEAPAILIRNTFERMVSGDIPWEVLTEVLHHREQWQQLIDLAKYPGDEKSMMQFNLSIEGTGMTFEELVHLHWAQCHSTRSTSKPTPLRKFISSVKDIAVRTAVWDAPTHPSFYPPAAMTKSQLRLGFGRAFIKLANFVLLDADSSSPDELDWFQEYLSSHSTLGSPGRNLVRRLTLPSFLYLPRRQRENLLNMCEGLEYLTIGISSNNCIRYEDTWILYPVGNFIQDFFGFLPLCKLRKLILVRGGPLRFSYESERDSVASQIPTWLERVATALRQRLDGLGNFSTQIFVDHGSDWTICGETPL